MESRDGAVRVVSRTLIRPRLKVTYPQVERLRNAIAQKVINQAFLETIYRLIKRQGFAEDYTKEGTGAYEVKLNDKGLLSASLDNYAYAKHAAHGTTLRESVNADTETGKLYALADFFTPGSNYRDVISGMIKQQIKERDIPLTTPFEKIAPDQDFYLTEEALVIYFQQNKYTPYVWGFPEFPIPYAQLSGIIDPKGPLARLARRK